jgi:propionyl-CoA synthetase
VADGAGLAGDRQLRWPRTAGGQAWIANLARARVRHSCPQRRRTRVAPGALPTLWHNDEGFKKSYLSQHEGFYLTGDAGYKDADGYLYVMSRIDDIINVAGHRLSTGGIEEVLASHPAVAECAVIGVADEMKGELPVGMVVLKAGVTQSADDIVSELVTRVRADVGAFACFKSAVVVKALPKTRSGKILRGTMKKMADSKPYVLPATIDDPGVLDEIRVALKTMGYARE